MALNIKSLQVQKKNFFIPSLEEVQNAINDGLKEHFSTIQVDIVDCPDLTQKPFSLANKGLHGRARLVELGSPSYLLPLVQREKLYNLKDIATLTEINPSFMIGAGAGPFNYANTNCEGIININIDNEEINQQTRISKINPSNGNPIQETLNNSVTDIGLLGNLFVCEGKMGKVLRVHAIKRIGEIDFIASLRTILEKHFGSDKIIGMGGTFLMKNGKAKTHVMPDFSTNPIKTDDELNKWLKFFNMSAPLIAVGTFTTGEYDLDLRVQHFHMFSDHGEAGHYHIDTTPDIVEYEGYFNLGEYIYRIDKPTRSSNFGKD